jgi:hypothetical protein
MIAVVQHPPDFVGLVAFVLLMGLICLLWRFP